MRSIQSTLFTLLAASSTAFAESSLNLTPGVTPVSHDIYELHMTIFWICVAIGVVVFGAMFYSILNHRKSKGAKPAEFHSHQALEITWTIIPFIILIVMAIPATKVLMRMNNTEQEELTIKITGYQWKWQYEYIEDGISFFSNLSTPVAELTNKAPKNPDYLRQVDHPIVVPIHKKIRFLITSNDVNHAWWVPELGVKRDGIAGFINEAWAKIDKPGTYRGQCAELCGINHAFMPIVVIATTEQGYKDWVAKQKGQVSQGEAEINKQWTLDELTKHGQEVYGRICAACHQPTGLGLPPTFPALKGSKVATGPIEKHIDTVFNGVSGTAMQAFKSQLSDVELASVITYERNAWGNNTGSMVQPIQIKALRDGKSIKDALTVMPSNNAPSSPSTPPQPKNLEKVTQMPAAGAGNTIDPNDTKHPQPKTVEPKADKANSATSSAASAPKEAAAASPEDALKAAIERGEKVYLSNCAACHQPTGLGMPPVFPALKGSAVATGPVEGHIHLVLNGKPGTAMQAFKGQLKDQDLADVITYERNAWGNDTKSLVKSEDIAAARQQEKQ